MSVGFLKSHHFTKFLVLVDQHHCRIKAKHVLVPDAVRDTVAVKLITENIRSRRERLLVFRKDRCPCKAKEQRIRKGCLNGREHLTEGRPVALINDKDKALLLHLFQVFGAHLAGSILFDIAHLLDGRDDQRILRISTLQFGNERNGILCLLHIICIVCKGAVFFQRLCAELNPVHQEHDLVRILGIGDQLRRFKRSHGFTRARRMPHISTELIPFCPVVLCYTVGNLVGGIILVAPHDLQYAIRIIRYGVEADQLMCHRNGQKPLHNLFPVVNRIIVQVCPMEIKI